MAVLSHPITAERIPPQGGCREYPFLGGVHCTSVGLANGKGEPSERMILQLRAVLRGISPLIW